ncbi:hypothetical protein A2V49_03050 [candidate division WWE3 bacterium RBG_19FT_COMBO_34_6]|uniref:RNA-binding protein KhpA n=1 Tax=candidate division WWE3 bacterium RBG_19FT_COMBO_34_6 TaxID=1802612 RepID=A0A1F4UL34_UNCKA|nr:MAG: hypothetical protein A2V49_03050 [candidate division WWE3 bacterium RBG_19FT_COMBO_34_6]
MQEFLEYIINQIVNKPEEVKISKQDESGLIVYMIEVADEDMGVIIGKEGRTIKSIRSLIKAKAIKDGVRVRIELIDKQNQQNDQI